jgi:alpha,alpha-trehalase
LEGDHAFFRSGDLRLSLWSSMQLVSQEGAVDTSFSLSAGEELWCAFGPDEDVTQWSVPKARKAVSAIGGFWRNRARDLRQYRTRNSQIRRSALLVDLLTFAPTGALLASPTTSLPARIGGTRNYDYRYCWIRDASLGLEFHSKVDSTDNARRFIRWLTQLHSRSEMPLQVLYRLSGETDAPLSEKTQLYGYRGSRPVRIGNESATSIEIDSFGYLMDSVLIYLERGGEWDPKFGDLVRRISDFTASNWRRAGAGIWEISPPQEFVISKVMSWVTLDRAVRIMDKIGASNSLTAWERARDEIHAEVMDRGWNEQRQSFRQRYDADAVDASLLLLPIVNFLSVDHPKVCSTIERIKESLGINDWLQRFVPAELPGQGSLPLGEEEGAFLMCSFWLARLHAMRGEIPQAESILRRAESIAAPLGLFSECIDARSNQLLGNMPLLFSQVEYAKAAIALNEAEQKHSRSE